MYFDDVAWDIRYVLRSIGDCTEEQLKLYFSDVMSEKKLHFYIRDLARMGDIDYDRFFKRIHWHLAPKVNDKDTEMNVYAFWLIAALRSSNVREIRMLPYPTQFLFIGTNKLMYDVTVVQDRTVAFAAAHYWQEKAIKGVPDEVRHIALCFDEETARDIAPYGFDSFCILDDDHVPHYGQWLEDNSIEFVIPQSVDEQEPEYIEDEEDDAEDEDTALIFNRVTAAKERVAELERELAEASKTIRKMEELLDDAPSNDEGAAAKLRMDSWANTFIDGAAAFSENQRMIYNTYRQLINFFPAQDSVIQQKAESEVADAFGIDARILDGAIVVKTPIMASSQNSNRFGNTVRYRANQIPVMAEEIRKKVASLVNPDSDKFEHKTIMVVSVYDTNEPNVPDADNILVKAQTDAITSQLPGGDSYENCVFYFQNLKSRDAPPGTYFIVINGFAGVLTRIKLLKLLKNFWL